MSVLFAALFVLVVTGRLVWSGCVALSCFRWPDIFINAVISVSVPERRAIDITHHPIPFHSLPFTSPLHLLFLQHWLMSIDEGHLSGMLMSDRRFLCAYQALRPVRPVTQRQQQAAPVSHVHRSDALLTSAPLATCLHTTHRPTPPSKPLSFCRTTETYTEVSQPANLKVGRKTNHLHKHKRK